MFSQLDEFTRELIKKLSTQELITICQKGLEHYPLVKEALNSDSVWKDLCDFHFGLKPFLPSQSKSFFFGEYHYSVSELKKAGRFGSFNALAELVTALIEANSYKEALTYAQQAAMLYGIVGHVLEMQVCEAAILKDHDEKQLYIQRGLLVLDEIENKQNEDLSTYYLALFEWDETLQENYGGLAPYLEKGRRFFSDKVEVVSRSLNSLTS